MHFSRDDMAYINGNGIPLVKVTISRNRYVYSHPVTGEKLATSPATDEGIKEFAAKFWYRPTIEIR
jgi:hypothetical protein